MNTPFLELCKKYGLQIQDHMINIDNNKYASTMGFVAFTDVRKALICQFPGDDCQTYYMVFNGKGKFHTDIKRLEKELVKEMKLRKISLIKKRKKELLEDFK